MNLIKKGIDWLNVKVESHCVESVYVITADRTRTVNATVIEPESRVNSDGIRVQNDTFTFLFSVDEMKGITIQRGIKFRRVDSDQTFMAVAKDGNFDDYNDPNLTRLAIPAKLCSS